ncbi:enoyl-CoA hydratase/isomerase family protein [Tropicimonas isoalkanivorans]|uniref:Enoyl-CoA hydratase/carnithine racemase n=1 Tax=Tropicimonas isoalkanivorans TaxID=441112 RepID=A0A1I1HX94_9RHOB|nr:enoyl-CoA hydratase/isomerase family protein [Tropicimonas isoalkanivorans]SFC28799.1 Enoyl-CoA hydratase/carnithine racemase [Tropicimonas isoalkanivorans]
MTDLTYEALSIERRGEIAIVKMNRPDQLNAVDDALHEEMPDAFRRLGEDRTVRAVVLTGAGRAFSAGGDIKAMLERLEDPALRFREAAKVPLMAKSLLASILNLPQPLVVALNGDAVGLGATMALAGDVVVMSDSARLGDTHVKVGLVAGDGGAVIWPALVGPAIAKELLMRGKLVSATEAREMGLVRHVVPAEECIGAAMKLAEELATLPPLAVQWTKLSVQKSILREFELIFDASIALETVSMLSGDYAAAVNGFATKTKPVFRGE